MSIASSLSPRLWTKFAGICALSALTLAYTPIVRAQDAAPDDMGDVSPVDADSLSAADTGFAAGEPGPRTQPYQVLPETPPPPTPGDWYSQWQNWKSDLQKKTGTSFELYLNPAEQIVASGPAQGVNRGVLWFNFHLEQTLWQGARLVTNTRGGKGDGLNRYVDSLFNFNQHQGEHSRIYISHLFLEQKLFNDQLTLQAGKMDLLDNFDANEVGGWNFAPYGFARNPSIPAPYHAIGANVRWDPTKWLYMQAGIADAAGDSAETGVNTTFRDEEPYFSIYEIGLQPKFMGRPGTYRFIFWNNSGDVARFDGHGVEDGDNGVDISFDQQVTDHLGLFARYGFSNPLVRKMHHFISVGGTYAGPIPGRKDDTLGFGVSHAILSHDYREANDLSATETQFDVYYKIQVQPWITVAPDVQVVLNPDQDTSKSSAVIAGVYVEMHF
ncbi:MAG TPA: carbohydrate porin [Tepidisphaeraceae bacterium]|jgi:carbohydrate-selective porin OprB|nr:carbohydrate porin [Tepidisphaeraceae bacterium]